jgi:ABC-type antimicrobial peptide transport system permease subunit
MKLAFDGMSAKQVSDVYKYDVRVDLGDKIEPRDLEDIEAIMTDAGAEYTLASYTTHVFRLDDRYDALNVLTGEAGKLGDFFAVKDATTGKALELPKDGLLAQKKLKESYGIGDGSTISVLSDELDDCSADVKGVFNNYVGRLVITSPEGYKKIFGSDAPGNCYFVKLQGADLDKLRADLLAAKDDISFEVASEFAKTFETASLLYNLIVIITTGIAILMSFMILSNLANIFLNRKKTELTVMRINGFSIKQTKGYLTKETVVTTAVGVILGVIIGLIGAPIIIKAMEQPDLQFVRTTHVMAWVIAVGLEVLFSIVINSFVFRKVKDLNFRDVA